MRRRANPWHLLGLPTSRVRILTLEAEGDRAGALAAAAVALAADPLTRDDPDPMIVGSAPFWTACRRSTYRRRVARSIERWDALPPEDLRCEECAAVRDRQ